MKKLIEELRGVIRFKETTVVNDIVLIVAKEPQLLVFAHVNDIKRDDSRKDEWWNIDLSILSIPLQNMTWTLRTPQMTGQEIFTMAGEERFCKAVDFGSDTLSTSVNEQQPKKQNFIQRIK